MNIMDFNDFLERFQKQKDYVKDLEVHLEQAREEIVLWRTRHLETLHLDLDSYEGSLLWSIFLYAFSPDVVKDHPEEVIRQIKNFIDSM